ncbi:MAG: signal peptide peptidase SppA [Candidatus Kapabacteria bacterium]|nr:signal peptide peptidase SppA [Ignavibacteriota bacterium]MCW5884718.1 signal peptide peptidase SppA [Candidatus Kapabacteria bacterium]
MEDMNQQQPKMPAYPPPHRSQRRRTSNWWIPLLIIGVVVALFFVFIAVIISQIGGSFEKQKVEVKNNSVLYLTFKGGMQEYAKSNPFSAFTGTSSGASFFETIRAIQNAADDEKIKGIYIKQDFEAFGWAKALELQEALEEFKKSGKFIYAFMEVGAENQYFNILPADSIFMPGEGIMELNGFGASSLFLKGFFEKIGIDYHVVHYEDFKSAADMYNQTKYTDSAKHQIRVILEQRNKYFVSSVAKHRNMSEEKVTDVMNRGIYTADSLLTEGFIDEFATELNVRDFIRYRANDEPYNLKLTVSQDDKENLYNKDFKGKLNLVGVSDYLTTLKPTKEDVFDKDIEIAVVNGVGPINSGRDTDDGFSSDYTIRSGDFVRNLRKARNNDKVKAIIIRIDSPGGSVIASEEIWDEIIRAKSVKPVYASMSDVAASGGYYMAMACDTIIAHPATITGSIGVVMAIPNVSGTMSKLGMTADTISLSNAAQFMNGMFPYDKQSMDKLRGLSRGIYDRFITRAAESRGMTYEELRSVAKGRVWTGEDAKERNLVDALGGLNTSIDMVKNRLGIPLDKKVYVRFYPEKVDDMQLLLSLLGLEDKKEDEEFKLELAKMMGLTPEAFINNWNMLPDDIRQQMKYMFELSKISSRESAMVAMPYMINIK